jgi:predicted nuclease with TOPRIM domain
MDWGQILLAALTGGAIVKIIDAIIVRFKLKSADTNTALQVLMARVGTLNKRIEEYENKVDRLISEREELTIRLAKAQEELAQKQIKIDALKAENEALSARVTTLENDIVRRDEQIEMLQAKIAELVLRIDQLQKVD